MGLELIISSCAGVQKRKKLTMMVIPSIFVPEDWSFTFYEGLNRHPDAIFKDRTLAELGCGNGWISIAIAQKWLPSKVHDPFILHTNCFILTFNGVYLVMHVFLHLIGTWKSGQ